MQEFELLETELMEWTGQEFLVACSSGSAALHLALEAMRIPSPEKREIIIPDYTMIACANAAMWAGLNPVFVDCDSDNLLMNPDKVRRAVTKNTVAIMAVHIYGRMCAMDEIHRIAGNHDLLVIEDMAEAHGMKPHKETHAACWSFYRNKVVAGEEGGCVSFYSPIHSKLARSLRSLGMHEQNDYTHQARGHNYRMSNVHAKLVRQSLSQFGKNMVERREIVQEYDRLCPEEWRMPPRHSPWVYDLRIKGMRTAQRDAVLRELRDVGVQARPGFVPMTSQQGFRDRSSNNSQAQLAAREVIYLPINPGMSLDTCTVAMNTIRSVMGWTLELKGTAS